MRGPSAESSRYTRFRSAARWMILACAALVLGQAHAIEDAQASSPSVVQGETFAIAIDAQGNRYIAGDYTGARDFNPGVGTDEKGSAGFNDVFITRYDANGAYKWTQVFGGDGFEAANAITVVGTTVYVAGSFNSSNAKIGAAGTGVSSTTDGGTPTFDAFLLALDAATGAPITGFSGDGIQTFGGIDSDFGQALAASATTVYLGGLFRSPGAQAGGAGPAASSSAVGTSDIYVVALNATTGAPIPAFSGDAIQSFGGSANDYGNALALNGAGTVLYVGGAVTSTNNSFVNSFTGNTTNLSTSITNCTSLAGVVIGQSIVGPNIPANATVAMIPNSTTITLSVAATGTATAAAIQTRTAPLATVGDFDGVVLALDATTGLPVTAFSADGVQTFAGTDFDDVFGITVSGANLFMTGAFSSFNAGIGGVGTQSSFLSTDAFVAKLNATTGAADLTFGTGGIVTFGGDDYDQARALAVSGQTLYVSGDFTSFNAGIGGFGDIETFDNEDAFILALDLTTGALNTTFSGDGIETFGGSDTDVANGLAVAPGGKKLYVAGLFMSSDAKVGGFDGPGPVVASNGFDGFVLTLDTITDRVAVPPIVQRAPAAIAVDGLGNRYVVGNYDANYDFNPRTGVDARFTNGGTDVYVTSFAADGTYRWTQTFGGSGDETARGITVANGIVYASGDFDSTDARIGEGTLTVGAVNFLDAFILALNAETGEPVTTFGFDVDPVTAGNQFIGVLTLDGGGDDTGFAPLVVNGTLYIAGTFEGLLGDFEIYVNAMDAATGASRTTFNNGGFVFGGSDDDFSLAVAADATTLYVGGNFNSFDARFGGGGGGTVGTIGFSSDAVILAVDLATAAPKAAFSADGVQTFGGSDDDFGAGLAVAADGTIYLTGSFRSRDAGVGTAGTIDAGPVGANAYVLALDAAGNAKTAFSVDGVQTFGGSDEDIGRAVALSPNGATVYFGGEFFSTDAAVGSLGSVKARAFSDDAFIVALDTATGLPRTAANSDFATTFPFSSDGVKQFGGSDSDGVTGLAATATEVIAAGRVLSGDAGLATRGRFDGEGFEGFILPLDIRDGTFDLIVTNTLDNEEDQALIPGSLRSVLSLVGTEDRVRFDPNVFDITNSEAATVINVLRELPPLGDSGVTIDGSQRKVTINGSAAGSANGLVITSSDNVVQGISIIGFTRSGIIIRDFAKRNVLGGDRSLPADVTGPPVLRIRGPNGRGLRIAKCGASGIEINGAGATDNRVLGSWIGLDALGVNPEPNLSGILIRDGAKNNFIGTEEELDSEANVISSNTFEGVTVSDVGSDGNQVVGNIVGLKAPTSLLTPTPTGSAAARLADSEILIGRGSGNGASGVFISKGTQGSKVGGAKKPNGKRKRNVLAFNARNGVEVRSAASRANSASENSITGNGNGGIDLQDGSNNGIVPPTIDTIVPLAATGSVGRAAVLSRVSGRSTAPDGSTVEVFNDPERQGRTFLGRGSVSGGQWTADVTTETVESLTATVTDPTGNTSEFVKFGDGGGTITPEDLDGDGVSNDLETLAGTDPNNSSDVPGKIGTGGVSLDRSQIALSFSKGTSTIKSTLSFRLPADFVLAGTSVGVAHGKVLSPNIVVDAKGKGPKANATVKLAGSPGLAVANGFAKLTYSLKAFDQIDEFDASGLKNTTTNRSGDSVSIVVGVVLNYGGKKVVYSGPKTFTYKATSGKTGRAKF